MVTTFNCKLKTEVGTESWNGRITRLINHGSHYEIKIESRSGLTVMVGTTSLGNFACIPDWDAGCHLSSFDDIFWNEERLTKVLGTVDGITVARALAAIADSI